MSIIILAHGRGERLRPVLGDQPKHLISLGTETILERTLRMFRGAGVDGDQICVVGPASLGYVVEAFGCRRMSLTNPGFCILDGLEQTEDLWSQGASPRTGVFLGDVIWSRHALAGFMDASHRAPGAIVFGHTADLSPRSGEIFGVNWPWEANHVAMEAIKMAHCRKGQYEVAQPGHLRNMLWWLQKCGPQFVLSHIVSDWTIDIDKPEDMARLPRLRELIAEEGS